jgi:hypothetical protein
MDGRADHELRPCQRRHGARDGALAARPRLVGGFLDDGLEPGAEHVADAEDPREGIVHRIGSLETEGRRLLAALRRDLGRLRERGGDPTTRVRLETRGRRLAGRQLARGHGVDAREKAAELGARHASAGLQPSAADLRPSVAADASLPCHEMPARESQ